MEMHQGKAAIVTSSPDISLHVSYWLFMFCDWATLQGYLPEQSS